MGAGTRFDVAITGGGMAGLCAAISAARHGARTVLIQDRPVLGGNCSSEIRVVPFSANHSNAWSGETGLMLEMLLRDRANNHETLGDHGMINSNFDLNLLEFARAEPSLTLLLNTSVFEVALENGAEVPRDVVAAPNGLGRLGGPARRIAGLKALQTSTGKSIVIEADQFVDATGDGTIGFLAGADYRQGRESRVEFGETLAPVEADQATLGSTITFRARREARPIPFEAPDWAIRYETLEDVGFCRDIDKFGGPFFSGFWWLEVCSPPFDQVSQIEEVRHELHRHLLGIWDCIKNRSAFRDQAANYALDWIGMIPGKRESRRLMGDVIFSERHCHADARWPDAVGYAGWWIDLHIKGGVLNKSDPPERENVDSNYKHWIRTPIHGVPLRALYSRNVANLWMAGRCMSATHVGIGSIRIMQTLGQLGQSVGTAAAYAVRNRLSPRETADPAGPHLQIVRRMLLRDDVRIPGCRNDDSDDRARTATATATSEATLRLEPAPMPTWHRLGPWQRAPEVCAEALAMVVPIVNGPLRRVALFLRNRTGGALDGIVSLQPLSRIWDRDDGAPLVSATFSVPCSDGDWAWVELPCDAPAGPFRVVLEGQAGIEWATSGDWPTATAMQYRYTSAGGPDPVNAHLAGFQQSEMSLPSYVHWRQALTALSLRLDPPQRPFAPANVVNGRAWPEDLPNLWVSAPSAELPQCLELAFERAATISRVQLVFDTNLARATQSQSGFYRAPECVRAFTLSGLTSRGWQELARIDDNFQRRRIVEFEPLELHALKVAVRQTNGDRSSRIFEIRAY